MTFLILLLGLIFVALCVFLVMIILVQPAKKGGGLGSLGGGAATGALSDSLGATQAEKSMAQWTKYGLAAFFIMALGLTLISNAASRSTLDSAPDDVDVENAPAGAAIQTIEDGADGEAGTVIEFDGAGAAGEAPAEE